MLEAVAARDKYIAEVQQAKNDPLPNVTVLQRKHMSEFIDNMIEKLCKDKSIDGKAVPKDDEVHEVEFDARNDTRRGIGYLIDQVVDISQIIPDERPLDDPEVLESENPKKVIKILQLMSNLSSRWFIAEYFYSYIDKPWF